MRNLVPVSQYERHLNLPDEFGEVAFAVPDDENKFIYVGGTGLYIACIAEGDLQVRIGSMPSLVYMHVL